MTGRSAPEDIAIAAHSSPDAELPLVTVILCTRGRRGLLDRCLASLRSLDDPNYEVLVVENDAVPGAADVAGANVRWVHEPRAGLAFARNRGIKEAGRGGVVAFVDDDCEVDPRWLTELRAGFVDPSVACVTGRARAASIERRSERWFERLASFDRGPEPAHFLPEPGQTVMPHRAALLGTGCNMAFRRDVFDRVGLFDTALDTPSLIRGGGDLDMFARVLEATEPAVYVPTAIVRHHHRRTIPSVARQLFGYGVGLGALSIKYLLERRADRREVLAFQSEFIRAMFRRRNRGGNRVLSIALIVFEIAGDVVGPIAYLVVRRRNRRLAGP
jgi:GT2 family glycosyltransferase